MLIVHLFVTCSYAHVNLCRLFYSSWCQRLAATSDCGSSWTFLFTFFQEISTFAVFLIWTALFTSALKPGYNAFK